MNIFKRLKIMAINRYWKIVHHFKPVHPADLDTIIEMDRDFMRGMIQAVRKKEAKETGKHVCMVDSRGLCTCDFTLDDPDDLCPVHGIPAPPRCFICGRFMKREKNQTYKNLKNPVGGYDDLLTNVKEITGGCR